jgi:hypothetical protein
MLHVNDATHTALPASRNTEHLQLHRSINFLLLSFSLSYELAWL